jgi:hypothetical protein
MAYRREQKVVVVDFDTFRDNTSLQDKINDQLEPLLSEGYWIVTPVPTPVLAPSLHGSHAGVNNGLTLVVMFLLERDVIVPPPSEG